jgi:drug/metabolite transporter (DMT)-like permease
LEVGGTVFPFLILYQGLATTSALEASLIGSTGPIFVVIGGVIFLGERETKREWRGLGISLLGSLLLIVEPVWNGHGLAGSSLSGNLLVLLYTLLYAVYAVTAKRYYRKSPPLAVGSLTYLVSAGIYALLLSYQNSLPPLSLLINNSAVSLAVLYMALPGTILAFIFYLYAQSRIEVSEANLFTYLNGVVAIPAAFLLLGEIPTPTSLVAIGLIAAGVYLAESRPHSKKSRSS